MAPACSLVSGATVMADAGMVTGISIGLPATHVEHELEGNVTDTIQYKASGECHK